MLWLKYFSKQKVLLPCVLISGILLLNGCEEDNPEAQKRSREYQITAIDTVALNINGTATLQETDSGTQVTLDLDGTADGVMHPAHIHNNSVSETGDIAINLNPVDGSTGMSTTMITEKNNGDPISYDQLLNFDGYINIHRSQDDFTPVANGNIGANVSDSGNSGTDSGSDDGGYDDGNNDDGGDDGYY